MTPVLVATVVVLILSISAFSDVEGQTGREWITESTVTFGRGGASAPSDSFFVRALALGDLGLRWTEPSGRGVGLSLAGGYDVPNEAVLGGLRGRAALGWERSRLEGSVGLFASSAGPGGLGGIVGVAYYPVPLAAVVGQVDILPTTEPEVPGDDGDPLPTSGQLTHDPSLSVGLRVAGEAGTTSWVITGGLALLAIVFVAGY